MLTELSIRNFKAWKNTGKVRLAPITVFFGSNSAGKTSLLQFLLMLRQTAESPDRHRVLHPGDRNTPVELGTFRELTFEHDLSNEIEFAFAWGLPKPMVVEDPLAQETITGSQIRFSATIASDPKGPQQQVRRFQYLLANGAASLAVEMKPLESSGSPKYELLAHDYKLVRNQGRPWKLPPPIRFYAFPDEVGAYYQNAGFTSDLALELEKQLKRLQYLGPLRIYPERSYIWSGEVPEHVGWRGERAVEAMLAAAARHIGPGYKRKIQPFQAVVARWLKDLGLLQSFEVRPIAAHRKEYEVMVRAGNAKESVNLSDVGFGVSQVLPVVVQCFYANPHTTIILEQPEIHLHPSVQTALADLFIEAIQSREEGQDRSIQLIIESHSEHFLRRLQRRVAEQTLNPKDVALYFCHTGDQGAILSPLEVDLYGEILNWPEDFFGDEMGELAARMAAAAQREAEKK
jgi:predicted ATPase